MLTRTQITKLYQLKENGLTPKEIAKQLRIPQKRIYYYLKIYRKDGTKKFCDFCRTLNILEHDPKYEWNEVKGLKCKECGHELFRSGSWG